MNTSHLSSRSLIRLKWKQSIYVIFIKWINCDWWTGDGKCVICDSYVKPCTLVRICDECNYGSYQGRCVICGNPGVSDAYYCKECTMLEKDVCQMNLKCCVLLVILACEYWIPFPISYCHVLYMISDMLVFQRQRDGCPKIVNLGSAKTDLFYERKKYGFKVWHKSFVLQM